MKCKFCNKTIIIRRTNQRTHKHCKKEYLRQDRKEYYRKNKKELDEYHKRYSKWYYKTPKGKLSRKKSNKKYKSKPEFKEINKVKRKKWDKKYYKYSQEREKIFKKILQNPKEKKNIQERKRFQVRKEIEDVLDEIYNSKNQNDKKMV